MRIRISDREGFTMAVFGADCFLEYWPQLLNEGMQIIARRYGGETLYYLTLDGSRPINDTAFFTREDLQHLEVVDA